MFKTIFSKLVAIFVLILLIAFTITGIMLNLFLGNYMTSEKAKTLEASSDGINRVFSNYLKNIDNPLADLYLSNSLDVYSAYTGSIIWIVDETGHIYRSSPDVTDYMTGPAINKYKDNTGFIKLPDARQYGKVMVGQGVVQEIGDFYGFFKDSTNKEYYQGDSWLTVEKPYKYKDARGNSFTFAVYLHTPVPEVQKARSHVFNFFMISMGGAVFVSVILVYIFSLRFSKPLKQISNAARVIAGGEFSNRLSINSNDEIGELARTFNQMAVALQNLEEMRRGFIANVSHELRTPMTSIRGFIEGMLDGTIPAEKQEYYLTIVRDETNRLNRLVNDLLDLAKMEAGEMTLNTRNFNLNELVRKCIIKLETLLVKKNLMVEANFEEEDMYVNADPDAIERVVYNLVHNAIKFTPENGRIVFTVKKQKDRISISIEDNGAGIESSELDMIWERFYKSDKSRSRDKTGTGLGLAIVKNIISEHGQQIWVESELSKGTKFTFTLNMADHPVETES